MIIYQNQTLLLVELLIGERNTSVDKLVRSVLISLKGLFTDLLFSVDQSVFISMMVEEKLSDFTVDLN